MNGKCVTTRRDVALIEARAFLMWVAWEHGFAPEHRVCWGDSSLQERHAALKIAAQELGYAI